MRLIKPNCRIQFTAEDLDFMVSVLGKPGQNAASLLQLLADEETRDLILDNEALYHRLLEDTGCLRVSSHFYFYIMVRTALKRTGIDDTKVADYVAEVLAEFSKADHSRCLIPGQEGSLDYFFEMLAALKTADERTSFCIRAHIGNHSLFLSGIFLNRIKYRAEYRGFPDLSYYESLGQSSFKVAGDHRLAARYDLAPVFSVLATQFHTTRLALNDLSERVLVVGDVPSVVGL
jgi:hypothetical protein